MIAALRPMLFYGLILTLAGCAQPKPAVEDLAGRENLSAFTLQQVRGIRHSDQLDAEARFSDGAAALVVRMRFAIGSPTKLESGRWQWTRNGLASSGSVAERSVLFLGGQSGPPSIGGRFDLLDQTTARYRITIPTTELKIKLPPDTDWIGR